MDSVQYLFCFFFPESYSSHDLRNVVLIMRKDTIYTHFTAYPECLTTMSISRLSVQPEAPVPASDPSDDPCDARNCVVHKMQAGWFVEGQRCSRRPRRLVSGLVGPEHGLSLLTGERKSLER